MWHTIQSTMNISEYITPITVNGLHGRLLFMPNTKHKQNILLLYGHHSSLERMTGVVEDLHQYGSVTMPDWPGFGGMDSFYKIGMKPTFDDMADYLATIIKLRFKNRKITVLAMSYAFVVVTRMLQKYPHLAKNINILISVVGFCHKDDFKFSKSRYRSYKYAAQFFSYKLPALFFRNVVLSPAMLRVGYGKTHNAKNKFKNLSTEQAKQAMDFEIHLWRSNDLRTHMFTTVDFLTVDNCTKQVKLPVHHISVDTDQYFDNFVVEQHMRIIFTDFIKHKAHLDSHAPSIIADKQAASGLLPLTVRKLLKGAQS